MHEAAQSRFKKKEKIGIQSLWLATVSGGFELLRLEKTALTPAVLSLTPRPAAVTSPGNFLEMQIASQAPSQTLWISNYGGGVQHQRYFIKISQ